jgi:hypothetical protein
LQDNGYTATTSSLIANLGSELATQLPPGSGTIAQISLDTNGSLTINASDLVAAQILALLSPKNIVQSTETGSFVFSNAQGSATVYTPASIINALNNLVFPMPTRLTM